MKRIGLSVLFGLITMLLFAQVLLAQATATVDKNANLRAGPGTTFAVVGSAKAGTTVTIVGSNAAGDWYQLTDGKWIAAFLVKNVSDDVPVIDASATVTSTVGAPTDEASIEAAYVRAIAPILTNYASAMDNFSTQMAAAAKDNSLLLNDEWIVKTAVSFAAWNILADQARALRPPARLMDAHNQLLIAATHFEKAGELLANGIDEMDGDLIEQGGAEMQLGVTAIELASDKLESLPTPTATALPTKGATATATPKATTVATAIKSAPTNTPVPPTATSVPPTATTAPVTTTGGNCDPSYPTLCIPPGAPDLDCGDIDDKRFTVLPPDPHRFDSDKDGIGCES